jgi:outer membrane protein assembly factor BamB
MDRSLSNLNSFMSIAFLINKNMKITKNKNKKTKKIIFPLLIFVLIFNLAPSVVRATTAYDSINGIYTDDFANNSGVPTRSYINVNTATGALQLTNASNQSSFATPYKDNGYAITGSIAPVLLAKWGTISLDANIPEGTTLKIQVMDDSNTLFSDTNLPGNSSGVEATNIDISNVDILHCAPGLNCNKPYVIKIKFLMTTTDTAVTPTINNLTVTWATTQGDLSAAEPDTTSAWPSYNVNQQSTNHVPFANSQIYPTFKWASAQFERDYGVEGIYILDDKIFGYTGYYGGYMFAQDKDTGEDLWRLPYNRCSGPRGSISSNGTFYGTDIGCDGFYVIDTNTGQLKWLYNFYGGHGSGQTIIGSDGTIYTDRNSGGNGTDIFYAFNPDGSIKWTKNIILSETVGDRLSINSLFMSSDDTIYLPFSTYDSSYNSTNHGKLVAINSEDGSTKWTYNTGDLGWRAIIDNNGTIYVTSDYQYNATLGDYVATEKKIFAINPDGTLKWERTTGENTKQGYNSFSLRNDGILLALRGQNEWNEPNKLEAINTSDGSLLWSEETTAYDISFSDNNNGFVYADGVAGANANDYYTRVNYFDSNANLKWRVAYPYNTDPNNSGGYVYYSLGSIVQDERGWIYGSLGKGAYDNDTDWNALPEEMFAKSFALAPWTLSNQTLPYDHQQQRDTLNFSVVSSMLETNPVFSGDNKVQVIMDNGDKIALSYSGLDASGNSLWTGSYTIPADAVAGTHTYTIEAAQSYLQTDITTHFASAPTESNNTGITATGTYYIYERGGTVILSPTTLALTTPNNTANIATPNANSEPASNSSQLNSTESHTEQNQTQNQSQATTIFNHNQFVPLSDNEKKLYSTIIESDENLDDQIKYAIAYFINFGTPNTKHLGAGERAGVIKSYKSAFKKLPRSTADWEDIIKIANGIAPIERSQNAEDQAKKFFKTIYQREADITNVYDNNAIIIMAYGLRPTARDLNSELSSIKTFKVIFGFMPQSTEQWNMIKAIAYSGVSK